MADAALGGQAFPDLESQRRSAGLQATCSSAAGLARKTLPGTLAGTPTPRRCAAGPRSSLSSERRGCTSRVRPPASRSGSPRARYGSEAARPFAAATLANIPPRRCSRADEALPRGSASMPLIQGRVIEDIGGEFHSGRLVRLSCKREANRKFLAAFLIPSPTPEGSARWRWSMPRHASARSGGSTTTPCWTRTPRSTSPSAPASGSPGKAAKTAESTGRSSTST